MPTYNGYTVLAGVKWTVDKKTLTVTMKQSTRGIGDNKLHTTTWKNYCPYCKKSGILRGGGKGKGKDAIEGEITCTKCDNDFCGVTGYKKILGSKLRLTKASSSSDSATKEKSDLQTKKEALADLKKDFKEKRKPKKEIKIKLPPLKGIREGSYIKLTPPLVKKSQIFFISSIDEANGDMNLVLNDKVPVPGIEYKEKVKITNKSNKKDVATENIDKKIMLAGKKLKSINKIYSYLKTGGSGGFKYKYYKNWFSNGSGNPFVFNKKAMAARWNAKIGNCVFFAWAFYLMCKGAGIKVNIMYGTGTFPDGNYKHLWNTYGGKPVDCSSVSCKKYKKEKKVK